MKEIQYPWFVTPCNKAFEFLVAEYGFSKPVAKQYGHEVYVEYQKNDRLVSVVYEISFYPLVEFFHPTRDIRNRRIPKLQVDSSDLSVTNKFQKMYHKLCRAKKYSEADLLSKEYVLNAAKELSIYMNRMAAAIAEQEHDFITG